MESTLPKDVYEYLTNFADDRTVLEMLSVNKQFNNPTLFERIIDRKYPLLKHLKRENESWRHFYVRMIHYIAKLKEDYGIPYIPTKGYNPEWLYKQWRHDKKFLYGIAMGYAAEGGHMDIVQLMIEKGSDNFNGSMIDAAKGGQLEIVKFMVEKGATRFILAMREAEKRGHTETVNYLKQFI